MFIDMADTNQINPIINIASVDKKGILSCLLLVVTLCVAPLTVTPASAQSLPYSPVVEADGVLYLAGHLGRDPETRELAGEIGEETRQTLENIGATLKSVGASYADVVRCVVFLAEIEDFAAMNEVYRTFFPKNPPARSTVAVKDIVLGAKIEIECTAVRGHGETSKAEQ